MKAVEPIDAVELFPPLSRTLLDILRNLKPAEWERPTICTGWSVKDVAAHLLGGSLGRLWKRDATTRPTRDPSPSFNELVSLINLQNEQWVKAARRISPEMIIELLDLADRYLYNHFKSLAPNEPARITVAWAGEELPPNWFDIAREYTEKWLHQQHIREAVDQPLLLGRQWLFPVLDTFMRGMPYVYRNVSANDGTTVSVVVSGEAGGEWSLVRIQGDWSLFASRDPAARASICLDQDLAWRLFTKGISPQEAKTLVHMEGETRLGDHLMQMVSIMA